SKPVEQQAPKPAEQQAPKPVEQPAPKPVEQQAPKPVEQPASKPVEQPVPKPVEQQAPVVKQALKGIVKYSLIRPNTFHSSGGDTNYGDIEYTDLFIVTVTYRNAKGEMVRVENVSLPWGVTEEVEAPFTALINVDIALRKLDKLPLEFFATYSNSLAQIQIESGNKKISGDRPVTGIYGSLWKNINDWLSKHAHKSYQLEFTE
ncbi:MAG: hypothetical protein LBK97_06495, partial [Prevotellaceae bacterium]|nr:hypothetical protein [Prevotellaceae bacterium]